jgi:hypothetical protein
MMGGKNGRPVALARNIDITNFVRLVGFKDSLTLSHTSV